MIRRLPLLKPLRWRGTTPCAPWVPRATPPSCRTRWRSCPAPRRPRRSGSPPPAGRTACWSSGRRSRARPAATTSTAAAPRSARWASRSTPRRRPGRAGSTPPPGFGQSYIYSVTAIASPDPLVESAVASEQEVRYQDRFAPPPPLELVALAEGGRVRLIWRGTRGRGSRRLPRLPARRRGRLRPPDPAAAPDHRVRRPGRGAGPELQLPGDGRRPGGQRERSGGRGPRRRSVIAS